MEITEFTREELTDLVQDLQVKNREQNNMLEMLRKRDRLEQTFREQFVIGAKLVIDQHRLTLWQRVKAVFRQR